MATLDDSELPLQRAYRWEKERTSQIFLTHPMGGGVVRDFTWTQTLDEARRVATWLKAQGWEPGSRVAIMSKNTASTGFTAWDDTVKQAKPMQVGPVFAEDALMDADAPKAFTGELSAHLKVVNAQLDPHERLDFIAVAPEQWSVEAGFVTPTLKIKRNVVEKHYAGHFDAWGKARKDVGWHEAQVARA